ncbi:MULTISPECIES: protein TolQ [Bartonella]|uniref:Tol-Pal system protein TolQ n=1 Tax=Bartonella rochalimae ATCC BAA-1498 TaxID=685782 RepID=E6YND5_9HYPH|nr:MULTISPECIES: protein TolQ [Bartonella]AQX18902.1 Cell division and transport-associated protein TolQ [Bartonella sp. A1379B]AQX22127.1 biopolymer transport protein TolQ [Bartonella sp. 11B]AQX24593.1 biopolymer transport protein TolQ [Bartonella sp. 114]AQX25895.1 Cell division and transport-associated protein TolQ [Bartonella sp. Coyote22sub2]AQX27184.1 Cell division and transport-associated protein TolQ [Bartonella sp. Raccoon60]
MAQVEFASPETIGILSLFMQANWIVKAVMLGLIFASIWSWAIIFDKIVSYRRIRRDIHHFERNFWSGQSLDDLYSTYKSQRNNSMSIVFLAAMTEWKKSLSKGLPTPLSLQSRIDKAMDLTLGRESVKIESRLGFLATLGSAGPFIGLFGTVVGIMNSFLSISASQNTSLAIVAPGIAEALLATAIGLFAAIPAVIAYNKLTSESGQIIAKIENFADEFSTILSRRIDETTSNNSSL